MEAGDIMITLKIVDRNNKKTDITQLVEKVTWSGDYKQASRKLEFSIISNKYDKKALSGHQPYVFLLCGKLFFKT